MSNIALALRARSRPVRLRTATLDDSEVLRAWKNAHRQFFFHKEEIAPDAQRRWMEGYLRRDDDYMFIVQDDGADVGCMAVRRLDGAADVYNVILGVAGSGGKGVMSVALRMMLGYARHAIASDIGLKVLKANPAVRFYERNAFIVTSDQGDHLEMKIDWTRFEPVELA